ncbi:hypothetical protein M885DRAFT_207490 [Pelagophyceae sp. CCMP2097]|nr:hypothetical protein M885DRAFT_207490 [Pelagophyceae sp. CCMP2097]
MGNRGTGSRSTRRGAPLEKDTVLWKRVIPKRHRPHPLPGAYAWHFSSSSSSRMSCFGWSRGRKASPTRRTSEVRPAGGSVADLPSTGRGLFVRGSGGGRRRGDGAPARRADPTAAAEPAGLGLPPAAQAADVCAHAAGLRRHHDVQRLVVRHFCGRRLGEPAPVDVAAARREIVLGTRRCGRRGPSPSPGTARKTATRGRGNAASSSSLAVRHPGDAREKRPAGRRPPRRHRAGWRLQ